LFISSLKNCTALHCTEAEFPGLLGAMNSVDPDVQFTAEVDWEENKMVFLDLIITIDEEGFLRTDLHTKPNTKNKLLLPSSAHPPSVTRSSVYSLALRIRRICSSGFAVSAAPRRRPR
jgi:hypothetical protein